MDAIKSRAAFQGHVSERNWLFKILKHNLIDFLRRKNRSNPVSGEESLEELPEAFDDTGFHRGTWKKGTEPVEWRSPESNLVNREFWKVFHRCVSKLPEKVSRIVLMREMDGLSTDQICSVAGISESNFWVIQHRARIALQRCLQTNWFQ